MSLRRTISKSYIGIHPECRTGQEVPRVIVGPLRQVKKPVSRKSESPAASSGQKKKVSESARLDS